MWQSTSMVQVSWLDAPEDNIASAMNEGLNYARRMGDKGDFFCKWDDDDYYGPDYLLTVADGFSRGADAVARAAHWYRARDGKLWFVDGPQRQFIDHKIVMRGPTLAGRLDCADFVNVGPCGEDDRWIEDMLERGAKFWMTRAGSFCWMRYQDPKHRHSLDRTDQTLLWAQEFPVLDTGLMWNAEHVELDRPLRGVELVPDVEAIMTEFFG